MLEEQDLQDQMQTVLGMDQVAVMEMEVAEEEVGEVVEEVVEAEETVVEDERVGLEVWVELAVLDPMALTVTHSGTALVAEEEVGEVVEEVAEVEEMVVEDEWVGLVVLVELAVWDQMALTVTHSGTALAVVEEVEEVEEAQVEEEGEALEATEGAAVTAGEEGRDQ